FFTVVGPVNEILALLAVILFWRDSIRTRVCLAASLVLYSATVVLTLAYFVPRDLILFTWPIPDHVEQIKAAAADWHYMNWFRFLLGFVCVLFAFKGLDTYYASRASVPKVRSPEGARAMKLLIPLVIFLSLLSTAVPVVAQNNLPPEVREMARKVM